MFKRIGSKRPLLNSLLYLLLAIFLCTTSIYAWISISNIGKSSLIVNVFQVKSKYEFYVYQSFNYTGNPNDDPVLENDKCLATNDENCYLLIDSPTPNDIIDNKTNLVPSNQFSYALIITNLSNVDVKLKLEFADILSPENEIEKNKIQYAFLYEVTKVAYYNNGVEGDDIKDSPEINIYSQHFDNPTRNKYTLVENIELGKSEDPNDQIIIYFNLYFDENVKGYDAEGNPTSSLPFSNQMLTIGKINLYLEMK